MKNILTIIKKEFKRFFTDRRIVLSLFLPGILIFVIYSLMGDMIGSMVEVENDYTYTGYVVNQSQIFSSTIEAQNIKIELNSINAMEVESKKEEIAQRQKDFILVFPSDFDSKLSSNLSSPMKVEIFYNSAKNESLQFYQMAVSVLDAIESSITNIFDINMGSNYDLASSQDVSSMLLSSVMPLLLVTLIFSSCMTIAPESMAGEKERGTIATLLVTPIKRSELAIGKIISIGTLALLAGTCSFLGVILSFPKLLQSQSTGLDVSIYGIPEFALIFLVIISFTLLTITLLAILSTFAKSVKEATSYIGPVMIVIMILSLMTSFMQNTSDNLFVYLIPFYNVTQTVYAIFALNLNIANLLTTVISNLVYSVSGIYILTRMFNNERVMFSR